MKDVHELSFVAVPAQRRAGTTKNYGGEQVKDAPAEPTPEEAPAPDNDIEEKSIEARIRVAEALFSGHIDNE